MVDLLIEDAAWTDVGLAELADRCAAAVLSNFGMDAQAWEIAVLACDDSRIAELNAAFRGKSVATNVLSWPSVDRAPPKPGQAPNAPDPTDGPELGDIAIAFGTCEREAEAAEIPLEQHAAHLLVHAVLHLLGYDHETDADATIMERIETEILATMGYPDPYYGSGPD